MEHDTKTPPYSTGDKNSFGYVTVRDRWPIILTGTIDDVYRANSKRTEPAVHDEGKRIVEQLAKLKYEVQHDRAMSPIADDGGKDVEEYNKELEALEKRGLSNWYNVPWLYAECYLYRRIHTFFSLSSHWKSYDVFAAQKLSTFRSSRTAVLELASRYKALIESLTTSASKKTDQVDVAKAEELLFREMCEICLWGNATDLSLLTSLTYNDIQALQGSAARKAAEANILVNDLGSAFQVLDAARKSNRETRCVDIVLDNAGFELFVDLVLAGYLLASGLATQIVLHPKSFPWFVSDVVPMDFMSLLNALQNPNEFFTAQSEDEVHQGREAPSPLSTQELEEVEYLFQDWASLHAEGKIVIRPNQFWTGGGSFWRLKGVESRLWDDLRESELVIYKGDLNYRKLTGDAMWDPSTPFEQAIGPLGPGSGIRTLTLRTCKADVVVGLKAGEDERLRAMDGGGGDSGARKWAWSGKWAVAQFCNGKKPE